MIIPPEPGRDGGHDRSLRKSEQYELDRALRDATVRARMQARAIRRIRIRRFLGPSSRSGLRVRDRLRALINRGPVRTPTPQPARNVRGMSGGC